MDKASKRAIEEVCERCPLYSQNCGMLKYPSQCVNSGHFIDGYRCAEKDLTDKVAAAYQLGLSNGKKEAMQAVEKFVKKEFDWIDGSTDVFLEHLKLHINNQ